LDIDQEWLQFIESSKKQNADQEEAQIRDKVTIFFARFFGFGGPLLLCQDNQLLVVCLRG
jgi:hypothetical protein